MKGRKPQDGAIRRGISDAYGLVKSEGRMGVVMPADVAADPKQAEIWAFLAPPVNNFTEQDIPNLRMLVYWHAVAEQAKATLTKDGNVAILVRVGSFKLPSGEEKPTVRKNPALQVLKEASSEIRALSDMLGLSPLARSRIGLMDAVKVKSAADTAKMFQSIDAAYELPGVVVEDA